MNCKDARQLITGYVDGELDLVGSMEVESHLEDCGSCLQTLKSQRELKQAIRSSALSFDMPRGLENRVMAATRKESKASARKSATASSGLSALRSWRWLSGSASFALGAAAMMLFMLVGRNLVHTPNGSRTEDSLSEEIVSSHVRSLQASHLFDVASTDQHTVKPWFTGKLDYSPPVVDLADQGFPLTGGRLDYIGGRPVAALVYHRRKHIINLFVWTSGAGSANLRGEPKTVSLRGYHTIGWSRGGMTFSAISDVNGGDLKQFADEIRSHTSP